MSDLPRSYGAALCRLCGASEQQHAVAGEAMLGSGQWLYRCDLCAAAYLCPDLSAAAMARFYRVHYRRLFPFLASRRPDERLLLQMRSREFAFLRARAVADALPPGARVLEIGSGHGAFLGRLHALRKDLRLFAVEADNGERELALDGAPVRFVELDELEGLGALGLIALYHVFEHLEEPVGLLRRLARLASADGRLVIEVPDAFFPGSNWSEVHPAHTSYFSAAGLRRAILLGHWQPIGEPLASSGNLYLEARPGGAPTQVEPVAQARRAEFAARVEAARHRPLPPWRRHFGKLLGAGLRGRLSRWKHRPTLDAALAQPPSRSVCLGVPLDAVTQDEVVQRALAAIRQRRPLRLADVNTAKLIDLQDDPAFRQALFQADLCVADGMGVVWTARSLGVALPERVTGIDTMAAMMAACARHGLRPYLLGARAEVVALAAARLRARHPDLDLAGWHHGFFGDEDEAGVLRTLRASGADCLIAGLPSPRQDLFLARVHGEIGIPFVMGVGGAFDVLAGLSHRAPRWMQKSGLEWLFRLLQEPRRLGPRYLVSNTRLLLLWLPAWLATLVQRRF